MPDPIIPAVQQRHEPQRRAALPPLRGARRLPVNKAPVQEWPRERRPVKVKAASDGITAFTCCRFSCFEGGLSSVAATDRHTRAKRCTDGDRSREAHVLHHNVHLEAFRGEAHRQTPAVLQPGGPIGRPWPVQGLAHHEEAPEAAAGAAWHCVHQLEGYGGRGPQAHRPHPTLQDIIFVSFVNLVQPAQEAEGEAPSDTGRTSF
jgi:hypothetical protein